MADPQQTESVTLKLPSGEMVDTIVPAGMTDTQVQGLMREKHPEYFPADQPQQQQQRLQQLQANRGWSAGNIAQNLGRGISELGQGIYGLATSTPESFSAGIRSGLQGEQTKEQQLLNQAEQAERQGQGYQWGPRIEAAGHGLASVLPGIGPWAAGIGEQMGTGDVGGAIARAAPQAIAGEAPRVAGLGRAIAQTPAAGRALATAGELGRAGVGIANVPTFGLAGKSVEALKGLGTAAGNIRDIWARPPAPDVTGFGLPKAVAGGPEAGAVPTYEQFAQPRQPLPPRVPIWQRPIAAEPQATPSAPATPEPPAVAAEPEPKPGPQQPTSPAPKTQAPKPAKPAPTKVKHTVEYTVPPRESYMSPEEMSQQDLVNQYLSQERGATPRRTASPSSGAAGPQPVGTTAGQTPEETQSALEEYLRRLRGQ